MEQRLARISGKLHELREHWLSARKSAEEAGDSKRLAECDHFIAQCERVRATLSEAACRPASAPPANQGFFFSLGA